MLLLRWFGSAWDLRRLKRSSIPVTDPSSLELLAELKHELKITTPVDVRIGEAAVPPMTWGVFRPVILLPASAAEWTLDRWRAVLAHELAHVRRKDALVRVLTEVARIVYWLNPLVWYAVHRLEIERERACDDCVLRLGADAADYAEHLVAIARSLNSGSPAAIAMARPSQLRLRLEAILDGRARRREVSRLSRTALISGGAVLTVLIAAIQATEIPSIEAYTPALLSMPPIALVGQGRETIAPRQPVTLPVGEVSGTWAQASLGQTRPSFGGPLDSVREALQQAANALAMATPGTQIGRDGRATAMTAVATALRDVEVAIVFAAENPLQAAEPPAPSPTRPDFAVPAGMETRGPSQRAALAALRLAFDALAGAPGGDLAGSRARINAEIATAAKAIIAGLAAAAASSPTPDSQVTPVIQFPSGRVRSNSGKPLEGVRDALLQAANALAAATPGTQIGRDGRATAMTAVATALRDVEAAIVFAAENPLQAAEPPAPSPTRPDFAVPAGMETRSPSQRAALAALRLAFDLLAETPGGDLGGSRTRVNVEIGRASNAIVAGLAAAAAEAPEPRQRPRGIQ
jgi:hypothetical protein